MTREQPKSPTEDRCKDPDCRGGLGDLPPCPNTRKATRSYKAAEREHLKAERKGHREATKAAKEAAKR